MLLLQLKMIALGTAAAAVAALGLRTDHPRAAAAFGVTAAANACTLGHTLRSLMPLNNRLMAPGQLEAAESEEGIRGLLREVGAARLAPVRQGCSPKVGLRACPHRLTFQRRLFLRSGAGCTACALCWERWRWGPRSSARTPC